jgi:hypothetical protein
MEGPLEPNMGPSLADVLLCTFESTNAGFSSFPLRKLLSWEFFQFSRACGIPQIKFCIS